MKLPRKLRLRMTFTVTATDEEDYAPSLVCVPPSGSRFPQYPTQSANRRLRVETPLGTASPRRPRNRHQRLDPRRLLTEGSQPR